MATKSTYPYSTLVILLSCLITLSLISTTFVSSHPTPTPTPTPYNSTIVGHNVVLTRDLITITIHETKDFKKYIRTISKLESFNGLTNTTVTIHETKDLKEYIHTISKLDTAVNGSVTTLDRAGCVKDLRENLQDMVDILKAIRKLRRENVHTCAHALKHKMIRVKKRGKHCKKKLFKHMHEKVFKQLYKKKLKGVVHLVKDVLKHVKKIHPKTLGDLDLEGDLFDDDDEDLS